MSLLGAKDGSLWIGAGAAAAQLKNNELRYIPRESYGQVNSILEDQKGDIWMSLDHLDPGVGPLCRVSGTGMRCFDEADGLKCPFGEALAQDQSGSIWMGSYPEVCRWSPQHSDTYLPAGTHRGGTDVEAISIALYAGFLLVGFSKSGPHLGLEQLIDGQWQSLDMPGMKGSDRTVSALLIDKEGGLWLGRRVREYITY